MPTLDAVEKCLTVISRPRRWRSRFAGEIVTVSVLAITGAVFAVIGTSVHLDSLDTIAGVPVPSKLLPVPQEHTEQKNVFVWASLNTAKWPDLVMLHAIPNGGKRNKATAGKMKAEGLKPGVPDLSLPVARGGYFGLYIEMKRQRGGSLSPDQKWWRDELIARGYCWHRCNGAVAAYDVLSMYLSLPLTQLFGPKA